MTTIPSTGLLRSSGLPLTQNTAPVLDFRCLYTHDLRQKKKRWHDGILRFHTFNSRIMVYDVSRNFIGDKYWREPEAIQDGDELELEKGVLIQVEEAAGRTEQDLAPILNHHKTSTNDIPAAPPIRTNTASTAALKAGSTATSRNNVGLLKPKSLNALLGTPTGKYGRALLPEKSPYQARREARSSSIVIEDDSEQIERPAKRHKTALNGLGNKTAVQLAREAARIAGPRANPAIRSKSQRTQYDTDSQKQQLPITTAVINLDTDTEDIAASVPQHFFSEPTPMSREDDSRTSGNVNQKHVTKSRATKQTSPNLRRKDGQKARQMTASNAIEATPIPRKMNQDKNLALAEDDPVPKAREMSPSPYTLRFAVTKPRRKLMYRDLLPDQPPSKSNSSASHHTRSRPLSTSSDNPSGFERAKERLPKNTVPNQQSLPLDTEVEQSHSDVTRVRALNESHTLVVEERDGVIPPEVPFKEQDHQRRPDDNSVLDEDPWDMDLDDLDDFDRTNVSKLTGLSPSKGVAQAPLNVANPMPANASLPSAREIHNQTSVVQHAQSQDAITSKSVAIPGYTAPSKDSGPPSIREQDISVGDRDIQEPRRFPIKKSHSVNNTSSTKPNATRAPALKKQTSDLTDARTTRSALSTIRDRALGAIATTAPLAHHRDTVTGPWSREAFDLFGWRPGDSKNITSKILNTGL